MSLQDKMVDDEYDLVLITYPKEFDISKLQKLTYNKKGEKNTVVPLEKVAFQSVVPLINKNKKLNVCKPFADGLEVVVHGDFQELVDQEIDFFHSTKEPKYHCVDWKNITVSKEPQWPISLLEYNPYRPIEKKEAKKEEVKVTVQAKKETEQKKKQQLADKIKQKKTKKVSSSSSSDSE